MAAAALTWAAAPEPWTEAVLGAARPLAPLWAAIAAAVCLASARGRPGGWAIAIGALILAPPASGLAGGTLEPQIALAVLMSWGLGAAAGAWGRVRPLLAPFVALALIFLLGEALLAAWPTTSGGLPRLGGANRSPVALLSWLAPAAAWLASEQMRLRWPAAVGVLALGFRAAGLAWAIGVCWPLRPVWNRWAALSLGAAASLAVWAARWMAPWGPKSLAGSDRGHLSEPWLALQKGIEHFPWGAGMGASGGAIVQAKSVPIQLFAEFGLSGLVLLTAILAAMRARAAAGPSAALACLFALGFVDASFFSLTSLSGTVWAAMTLAMAQSEPKPGIIEHAPRASGSV